MCIVHTKYRCLCHSKNTNYEKCYSQKWQEKEETEDIAELDAELTQKHENELKLFQNSSSVSQIMMFLKTLPRNCQVLYIWVQLTYTHIISWIVPKGGGGFRCNGFCQFGKWWGKCRFKQASSDIKSPEETGNVFIYYLFSLKSLLRMLKIIGVFRTKRLLLRRNGRCGLLRQKWRISQAPVIKRVWSWDRSWWRGTCRSKRSPLMVTACTAPWRISWRSEAPLSALKSFGLKQLSTWGAMQTTSCRSSLTPIQETCTLQVNAILSP